jgi:hypothetical protein
MVTRASAGEVLGVLSFTPTKEDLQPFLDAANELVTELCGGLYAADRLKNIEIFLAAHFVAVGDRNYYAGMVTMESLGEQNTQYATPKPADFSMTAYGQQALLLDTKGGLAYIAFHVAKGKRAKVGVVHLGTSRRQVTGRDWIFQNLFAC